MNQFSELDALMSTAEPLSVSRADLLDVTEWLRSEVYPGIVGHALDSEGVAAWVCDGYLLRCRGRGLSHQESKDEVFRHIWAVVHHEPEPEWPGLPQPQPEPDPTPQPAPVLERLTVRGGRLYAGTAPFALHAISEFSGVHLVRSGNEGEFIRRIERAQAAGRNAARLLSMASILFDLKPSQAGYWAAMDRAVTLLAERGMYACLDAFADAQIIMPGRQDRRAFLSEWTAFVRTHANVCPAVANEARKNGWAEADDPALLDLARQFTADAPGLAFSISDPLDGDDESSTPETYRIQRELAQIALILVLHDSRKEDAATWARWVNHLKGFGDADLGDAFKFHREPMGAAGTRQFEKRDNRPEAHLAAACVAAIMQTGYCYHYHSAEDDSVPGLDLLHYANQIPQRPGMHYVNATLGDSPVSAFSGFEKVRTCTNGSEGWAVGYGGKGEMTWRQGWATHTVYRGDNCTLVQGTR